MDVSGKEDISGVPEELSPSEKQNNNRVARNTGNPFSRTETPKFGNPAENPPNGGNPFLRNSSISPFSDPYDDYKVPADLRYAELHGDATMVANLNNIFNLNDPQLREKLPKVDELKKLPTQTCPCCQRTLVIGEKVRLTTPTKLLGSLGTAIPGFFEFAKFTLQLYVLVFLAYSLNLLISYGRTQTCEYSSSQNTSNLPANAQLCGQQWKFYFTSSNGSVKLDDTRERLFILLSVVLMYLLKAYHYRKFRKIDCETDRTTTEITDYSVEVRGLPKYICRQDVVEFFERRDLADDDGKLHPIRVNYINFVYSDIKRIDKMTEKLDEFIVDYLQQTSNESIQEKKAKEGDSFDEEKFISSFDDKMNVLEAECQKELTTKYTVPPTVRAEVPNFTGNAYISFQTMKQTELVANHLAVAGVAKFFYKLLGGLRGCFAKLKGARRHQLPQQTRGQYFYVEKAEVPLEILFRNLGYSSKERWLRKLGALLLNLAFIAGTFLAIFVLKGVEFNLDPLKSSTRVMSVFISVVIKIAGFICMFVSEFLVDFSLPETTTDRNIGIIWRITVSMFFNSAILLVLANQYYQEEQMLKKLYLDVGLVNDLIMLLILSVIEAGLSFADPPLILNWINKKKVLQDGKNSNEIQKVVNTYYEGGVFVFPRRFSKYLNLMMLTFFMVRIFPLSPILAILICVMFYWADKLFLLRFSRIPEVCTVELPLSMLRFFDMALVVWSLGYAAFDDIKYGQISRWSWVMISIALANLLGNPNYALRKLFTFENDESDTNSLSFRNFIKDLKPVTYTHANPVDALKFSLDQYSKDGFLARIRLKPQLTSEEAAAADSKARIHKKILEEVTELEQHRSVGSTQLDTEMIGLKYLEQRNQPNLGSNNKSEDFEFDIPQEKENILMISDSKHQGEPNN